MEATDELVKKVANAIGKIQVNNSGIIGYSSPLSSNMPYKMLEAIARVAISMIPQNGGTEPS